MPIGVYVSPDQIRLCDTDTSGDPIAVEAFRFDNPLTREDWQHPDKRLSDRIAECVGKATEVVLAVPRGVHHIRRVPLEVAEDFDQKSQIEWEVGQTLASNPGDYRVDYEVRGSSAIWVAIASDFHDRLCSALERDGILLAGICGSSIAIANSLRQTHENGKVTCLVAESEWVTRLDLEDSSIVGIEAVGRQPQSPDDELLLSTLLHTRGGQSERTYVVGEPNVVERALSGSFDLSLLRIPGDWPQADAMSPIAAGASLHAQTERPA